MISELGKIVGMAIIYFRRTPLMKAATIECVILDKSLQSRGFGGKLNKLLIEEAKKRGARFVELTSRSKRKNALAMYKKQ